MSGTRWFIYDVFNGHLIEWAADTGDRVADVLARAPACFTTDQEAREAADRRARARKGWPFMVLKSVSLHRLAAPEKRGDQNDS